jgi:hypothetical protein
MKSLHINSYDGNGGAARATQRLCQALNNLNIESNLIVNYKKNKESTTKTFSNTLISRLYTFFLLAVEQLLTRLFV